MANTYTLINSATVGSGGASTIVFSSIPQTYTDLLIKTSARGANSNIYNYHYIGFNSAGLVATVRFVQGAGSGTPGSGTESTGYMGIINGSTSTASTFSSNEVYVPNYTSSNYKSYSVNGTMETNGTASYMHIFSGVWNSTAAITSITLNADSASGNSFLQGSTCYLYGIKNS